MNHAKEPWELTDKEIKEAVVADAPKPLSKEEISELVKISPHSRVHPEIERDEARSIQTEQVHSVSKITRIRRIGLGC